MLSGCRFLNLGGLSDPPLQVLPRQEIIRADFDGHFALTERTIIDTQLIFLVDFPSDTEKIPAGLASWGGWNSLTISTAGRWCWYIIG